MTVSRASNLRSDGDASHHSVHAVSLTKVLVLARHCERVGRRFSGTQKWRPPLRSALRKYRLRLRRLPFRIIGRSVARSILAAIVEPPDSGADLDCDFRGLKSETSSG